MSFSHEPDFPQAFACLKNVDNLLRCPICFDYLNISVMTQHCSHTFCSLCIRKFLSYKSQCPVCNLATTETDLRNNRILDDLVKSFQSTRRQLLQIHVGDSPPVSPKAPSPSAVKKVAVKRDGTLISHFLKKEPSCTQVEPSVRPAPEVRGLAVADEWHAIDGNAELRPKPATASSALQPDQSSPSEMGEGPLIVKVECPVCSVGISQQFINKHLDGCLRREEKRESLRSSLGKRKPLAKVVYSLLSLHELKRRLRDCHLSTQGTRDQLVRRHQDFLHLYNAQCDSLNPKSAQDIAKEIEKNEKARIQAQSKSKCMPLFSKGQTEEEIEEVHSNYRKQHSDEFSRLIAQVKGRWKTSKRAQIEREDEGGEAEQIGQSSESLNEDDAVPVTTSRRRRVCRLWSLSGHPVPSVMFPSAARSLKCSAQNLTPALRIWTTCTTGNGKM
ncbi:hypothetical protein GJAV_G00191210 [Gymnothorax javanicus]|nr:hypothetical protein GJAV_G00191210 [Gymnothorax javanicus]